MTWVIWPKSTTVVCGCVIASSLIGKKISSLLSPIVCGGSTGSLGCKESSSSSSGMMCVVKMFSCWVSGHSMVVQKALKVRAPDAVVVRPMLVVGSKCTVFVNHRCDQKSIIFLLVVSAPVPSSLGKWSPACWARC